MGIENDILAVKDLKVWFPVRKGLFGRTVGHVKALDGVSVSFKRGETLGVVGESGSGKTTLARVVAGLQKPTSGTVRIYGRIGMVFQDPFGSLNPRMTVSELNSLLNTILPMIQTNMSKMQILNFMADSVSYLNHDVETLNIPIKNSWQSATIRKMSVICPNFELNKTAILAHVYSTYRLDVDGTRYQNFDVPGSEKTTKTTQTTQTILPTETPSTSAAAETTETTATTETAAPTEKTQESQTTRETEATVPTETAAPTQTEKTTADAEPEQEQKESDEAVG